MSSSENNKLTKIITSKYQFNEGTCVNIGAEQALLGAILSNNEAFEKVEEFLESQFFQVN